MFIHLYLYIIEIKQTYILYISIYCYSSGSCVESGPSLSLAAAEALFSRLSGRTLPPAEISRLCGLRAVLVKNEGQLKSQLQEFRHTSTLAAGESGCLDLLCLNIKHMCFWFIVMLQTIRYNSEKKVTLTALFYMSFFTHYFIWQPNDWFLF